MTGLVADVFFLSVGRERKDQLMKAFSMLVALAGLAGFAAISDAAAAQNNSLSLGCTMQQIIDAAHNTPAGRECSRRQDESVINGTTFIAFVCTSNGVYCCPVPGGSEATCTKISSLRTPKALPLSRILKDGKLKR
jgi:hypothetical protein